MWLPNLLANMVPTLMGITSMSGAIMAGLLALALSAGIVWHRRQRREGKPGVEASYLIIGGLVGAALLLLLAAGAYTWQQYLAPTISPTAPSKVAESVVGLSITEVRFDPNGSTELYVDFNISNTGPRTTIRNWSLSITDRGEALNFVPRMVDLDKLIPDQWGHPVRANILKLPIESGESWPGHATFTVLSWGSFPQERFKQAGVIYEISGYDLAGHRLSATYKLATNIP
jgi:hypothetical protein